MMPKCSFLCILLISVFFSSVLSLSARAAHITHLELDPAITKLIAGDTFDIKVRVDDLTDFDPCWSPDYIFSFGFDIDTDGSQFSLISAAVEFPFLDDSIFLSDVDVAGLVFPSDPTVFSDEEVKGGIPVYVLGRTNKFFIIYRKRKM